jgi:hypothetical protein
VIRGERLEEHAAPIMTDWFRRIANGPDMSDDKRPGELKGVEAEAGREEAEDLREEADQERDSAEEHRSLAESARTEAEQFRVLAEEAPAALNGPANAWGGTSTKPPAH